MRPAARAALLAGLAVAATYSGYRIVAHTVADDLARDDPTRALQLLPDHPGALLALAERQLEAGDHTGAARTAGELAKAAPLDGRAWRILGQVEAAAGNREQARARFEQAVALRPRDTPSRAWLADDLLVRGEYTAALGHIERIMATSPRNRPAMLAVLVKLSADPVFLEALTPLLATRPDWRAAYLQELQRSAGPDVSAQVMATLAGHGGLDPAEDARWIDDLIRRGLWGQAYAHWAGTLPALAVLSPVYNGGFEATPSGTGFDWRTQVIPGQTVTFEAGPAGASGRVAALEFRGRPAPRAGLEQALLLAPGQHELQVRMRAEDLHSDGGLEWVVACADGRILGLGPRITGSFDWKTVTAAIEVPADCPGQRLYLRNPAPTARSQSTRGRLWIDSAAIIRAPAIPQPEPPTPVVPGLADGVPAKRDDRLRLSTVVRFEPSIT
ncbi:tetratricopeptide repeat protein [Pseudoxanthomonas koreensis]|uniref:tetratricopeptide repeat protein n=1 Tax=Pseudoxanthomonas koreensis TaxID=266061 RepID=UPI001390EDCB|nr:hypothetical protein [Pseudoxanthomonas koreensis]KAF1695292.1 hypothetical protein CSC64_03325 [Pseudoxanthomonas koreensis]